MIIVPTIPNFPNFPNLTIFTIFTGPLPVRPAVLAEHRVDVDARAQLPVSVTRALVIDLRVPLGLLFVMLELLLGGYGIAGDAAMYGLSLGFNLNLWCGIAMLIFGIAMLSLSRRGNA